MFGEYGNPLGIMSDHQIYIWFLGACAVFLLLQRIGFAIERANKQAQHTSEKLPGFVICGTPIEAQNRKEEISQFVSQYLGEKRERLKPDVRFVDDLRVPPGELDLLFEQIEEHFGITLHRKHTLTFGDLLALVRVRQPQD